MISSSTETKFRVSLGKVVSDKIRSYPDATKRKVLLTTAHEIARNMQSPDYNALYAESLPDLQKDLAPISGKPEAVLDLILTKDAHDFGSAAWFLATQCSPAVRNALRSGGEDGWRKYITSCVGTTVTEDRREVWERAVEALEGYQEENK